jgi:hypothetical protein
VFKEACLSLPGISVDVTRPKSIKLSYIDRNNQPQTLQSDGFLARVVQHEMDHLAGRLIVDHASKIKRDMLMKRLVIFMGSCSFAVPALSALIRDHQVTAIFTQEPKPEGRGLRLQLSPVHQHANAFDIPVYTPKTLRHESAFELIQSIQADLIVVCSYGFIVPENILNAK